MKAPRYFKFIVVVALLVGGGVYWAGNERDRSVGRSLNKRVSNGDSSGDTASGSSQAKEQESASAHAQHATIPHSTNANSGKLPNVFGLGGVVQLEDVPEGRFRDELTRLNEPARRRALDKLGELKVPLNDVASLSVEANGQLFYQCSLPILPTQPGIAAVVEEDAQALLSETEVTEAEAAVPIASPPVRHSRPGATKIIFLDFNGHTITGTAWNAKKGNEGDAGYRPAVASYVAKPFDADGDPANFSPGEQTAIVQVWERVAEDYNAFDVDVTTEEPAVFTRNTGRILVTDNVDANGVNMPSSTSAGVGYLDVFGDFNYATYYSPALVYSNQLAKTAAYIAEAASHEMGHNLSLSHDGTTGGSEYYGGHGSGENSWNTIMGSATSRNVTQWSKGEYYNANNLEDDDLSIIAVRLGYVADDHTDSNGTASPLNVSGLTVSGSGIISQTGEADRFSFASGAGAITINATTFRSANPSHGGNLDLALELYDSGGTLVTSANVDGVKNSSLSTTVSGGTYYLRVFGVGSGTPSISGPTGYTNYASLGQYTISGTVISTGPVAPSFTSQPVSRTITAGGPVTFSSAASGSPAPTFQWKKGGANIAGATTSSFTIANVASGNAGSYTVVATNASGTATSNVATLTVLVVAPTGAIISIAVE